MTDADSTGDMLSYYMERYRFGGFAAVVRLLEERYPKDKRKQSKWLRRVARLLAADGDFQAAASVAFDAFQRDPTEKSLKTLFKVASFQGRESVLPVIQRVEELLLEKSRQDRTFQLAPLWNLAASVRPAHYFLRLYKEAGLQAAIAAVRELDGPDRSDEAAVMLRRIANELVRSGRPDDGMLFALEAFRHSPTEQVFHRLVKAISRCGDAELALTAIVEVERLLAVEAPGFGGHELLQRLRSLPAMLLDARSLVGPMRQQSYMPVEHRLCYVLNSSFPYSTNGYSARSHRMAIAFAQAGYEVIALTRPGFPVDDIRPRGEIQEDEIIDGIHYIRTLQPSRRTGSLREYVEASAARLESRFAAFRPEVVVAASNSLVALPALIAARRLGIPFAYEIRGFWEVTRGSRQERFWHSQWWSVQRLLDTFVAEESDHVFTLTTPMKEELVARGVPADRIDLLPNSCDPSEFAPRGRDLRLAAKLGVPEHVSVIGYAGTLMDYEGLDDLVEACGKLKGQGLDFRLLIVGDEHRSDADKTSSVRTALGERAGALGYGDWLIMPGRVPYTEVPAYYSVMDICPFPRKPWPVCELVSPSKPLEALAMEKGVVVSSVRALTEIVDDSRTGLVFEKGNIDALAAQLARLLRNPGERKRLGEAGRQWVQRERTWIKTALTAERRLRGLLGKGPKRPSLAAAPASISP